MPGWLPLVLLSLAAFRVWRLVGEDVILDRPRKWLIGRGAKYDEWVSCPWCAGAWISVLWWLAWVAWPHWTLVVAVPFAVSAVVGLIGANIDPE